MWHRDWLPYPGQQVIASSAPQGSNPGDLLQKRKICSIDTGREPPNATAISPPDATATDVLPATTEFVVVTTKSELFVTVDASTIVTEVVTVVPTRTQVVTVMPTPTETHTIVATPTGTCEVYLHLVAVWPGWNWAPGPVEWLNTSGIDHLTAQWHIRDPYGGYVEGMIDLYWGTYYSLSMENISLATWLTIHAKTSPPIKPPVNIKDVPGNLPAGNYYWPDLGYEVFTWGNFTWDTTNDFLKENRGGLLPSCELTMQNYKPAWKISGYDTTTVAYREVLCYFPCW